ncbi:MAG: hypothetical protein IGR80_07240 [Synechococcales cyanobacterium K44_A2020_017]|nr:hypothetical protein [Synechococcales cyanobacterium K32_A2020_035]MBF2094538.1 hypothetical protein [Synechococcales cyanobacterium K44_A2020_017]
MPYSVLRDLEPGDQRSPCFSRVTSSMEDDERKCVYPSTQAIAFSSLHIEVADSLEARRGERSR